MRKLLLCIALLFPAATSSGAWTCVDGGTWPASQLVIDDLRSVVRRQFDISSQSYKAKHGVKTPQWDTYDFQYQGITRRGVRLVVVNAFCKSGNDAFDYTKEMWVVSDGGACYFHATYDPARKIVIDLSFNGIG